VCVQEQTHTRDAEIKNKFGNCETNCHINGTFFNDNKTNVSREMILALVCGVVRF